MAEVRFEAPVDGGRLVGHRGGEGPPALLLHGGPALQDYMGNCAAELAGVLHTIRYTQRGVSPSVVSGPYTLERHADDAVAVLDALGVDRAWAVGHSWGAHLALHLSLRAPERLLGLVLVGGVPARRDVFPEFDANMRRRLTDEQVAEVVAIEERRRRGEGTGEDLARRMAMVWPNFFAHPEEAPPSPLGRPAAGTQIGAEASAGGNASMREHFDAGTLVDGLPALRMPVRFVHGERDPMPARGAFETALLIPGASVEIIHDCGHFPWLERPGAVRDAVKDLLARAG